MPILSGARLESTASWQEPGTDLAERTICRLFVFVGLAHERRRVLHFSVTEHPTAAWTAQQIVDAFPDDSAPSYLSAIATRSTIMGSGNA